mmetsp:Transcript_1024/g.1309  ORF Transcript_1024/g.1309 Transcript_1024/m.1309 type:complete len:250 (+) Transcript_1024:131-880(+)
MTFHAFIDLFPAGFFTFVFSPNASRISSKRRSCASCISSIFFFSAFSAFWLSLSCSSNAFSRLFKLLFFASSSLTLSFACKRSRIFIFNSWSLSSASSITFSRSCTFASSSLILSLELLRRCVSSTTKDATFSVNWSLSLVTAARASLWSATVLSSEARLWFRFSANTATLPRLLFAISSSFARDSEIFCTSENSLRVVSKLDRATFNSFSNVKIVSTCCLDEVSTANSLDLRSSARLAKIVDFCFSFE